MNNENKKLPENEKEELTRKTKMDDKMKSLLKKTKFELKKKNKKLIKLEI